MALIGAVDRRNAFDRSVGIAVQVAAQCGDDVREPDGAHPVCRPCASQLRASALTAAMRSAP